MSLFNKDIRKEVWVKTLTGIITALILAVIFSCFDKVKGWVQGTGQPTTEAKRDVPPLESNFQAHPYPLNINSSSFSKDSLKSVDEERGNIIDSSGRTIIDDKDGRIIIDTKDAREIKLLDDPIIYFLPVWSKKLLGWFLIIYPFFIFPVAIFSEEGGWWGCVGCIVSPILFISIFLVIGFILSLILNYALAHVFKWLPAEYATYKIELFLNWIMKHL